MITAIIQARMGSSRLPGKNMMIIKGKPILQHIIERLQQSKLINKIMVATTLKGEDQCILDLCQDLNISAYIGNENDLLDRYWQGVKMSDATHIVRITADCPVIDAEIIDNVIRLHLNEMNDYTDNTRSATFPDGYDCSIIDSNILHEAWKNADKKYQREHVTPYILENYIRYKLSEYKCTSNLGHIRLTLDEADDLKVIEELYNNLYDNNHYFGFREVMEYIHANPKILDYNKHITRDEGLIISKHNEGII